MKSGIGEKCISAAAVVTLILAIHAHSQTKPSLDWPVYGGRYYGTVTISTITTEGAPFFASFAKSGDTHSCPQVLE
jgi:hypothetical protein